MKEMICIVCPRGCHLKVDEENNYKVTGNHCPKGEEYGRNEVLNPLRVVTSTVRIQSEECPRCPVKTDGSIPKKDVLRAMELLDDVELNPPVKRGDTVIKNILGTTVSFVATRDIQE